MNILFIGDIVGKLGRKALEKNLPFIKKKYNISFVIANAENITNGKGMSATHFQFLLDNDVDCITLGNHYDHCDDIFRVIENEHIVRPLNVKDEIRGCGSKEYDVDGVLIRVSNILGTDISKKVIDDPYESAIGIIGQDESDIHIIDFHAEYTGEKKAFAYSLKNSVSAIIGTHTHVQTRDYQILSTGPFYISDVGMCGLYDSVLGTEYNSVVSRVILHDSNVHFKQKDIGDTIFSAVVLKFDDISFKPIEIVPIYIIDKE